MNRFSGFTFASTMSIRIVALENRHGLTATMHIGNVDDKSTCNGPSTMPIRNVTSRIRYTLASTMRISIVAPYSSTICEDTFSSRGTPDEVVF